MEFGTFSLDINVYMASKHLAKTATGCRQEGKVPWVPMNHRKQEQV